MLTLVIAKTIIIIRLLRKARIYYLAGVGVYNEIKNEINTGRLGTTVELLKKIWEKIAKTDSE